MLPGLSAACPAGQRARGNPRELAWCSSMQQGRWQPSCPLLCTALGWPLPCPRYRGCGAENAPCSLRSDTPPTLQVKPHVFPTQQPTGSRKKSWGGSLMGQEHSPLLVLCPGDRNAPKRQRFCFRKKLTFQQMHRADKQRSFGCLPRSAGFVVCMAGSLSGAPFALILHRG